MIPPAIPVTFFTDYAAQFKREEMIDPAELVRMIGEMVAAEKARLPWLKLARFGDKRSEKRSLRHDANLRTVSGCEGDYDGEKISFDQAVAIARAAGLFCIIYTSPSHTGERPRWRVLCPTSREWPPAERTRLMARLNGLYGGIFAVESFTLSQSYYYGHIVGSRDHRVELVVGTCIDLLDALDEGAIGKPNGQAPPHEPEDERHSAPEADIFDVFAALAAIPNNGSPEWNEWNRIGLAICAATGGAAAGGVAFDTWSKKHPSYDAALTRQRWRHIVDHPPNRIGAGTLFHLAAKALPGWRKPSADARDEEDRESWPSANPGSAWPELDPAALWGLPGNIVRAISPHSEADPTAILVQFLVAAGNALGRNAYYLVEGDRHGTNLSAVLTGDSAKGRKGTSWGRVRAIMEVADPEWTASRIVSGMSSGEGLIWAVRDPIIGYEKQGKGAAAERVAVEVDPGVRDKRLLAIEPEFSRAIAAMRRDGNTLSAVVRDAWDRGVLSSLTKNSPARATGAHISIVGHITTDELRAVLDRTAMANGSANRILWTMVRRSNVPPFGGDMDPQVVEDLGRRTGAMIGASRNVARVDFDEEARNLWRRVYPELSAGRAGLLGAITNRAEAQAIRLSLVYALMDGAGAISGHHLRAALAVWKYAEASCEYIWGDALGDPVADEILRVLRLAGSAGKTRTEIRDIFGRNRVADEIGAALALLATEGKAACTTRISANGGRPAELWVARAAG